MDELNQKQIDAYLLGQMNDTERKGFEQQLSTNKELAAEFGLQQEAFTLLDAIGDQKMKATLDQIHNKVVAAPTVSFFNKGFMLAAAIAALVVFGIGFYLLQDKTIAAPDQLYATYFEPYPISLASRDASQEVALQQANALYKNKQYGEALPILDQLIENNTDGKLKIAAGISALESGAYQKAINYFDTLIDNNDPLYQSQAQWYAAMTALKQNNKTLAQKYLQTLVDSGATFKQKESMEILSAIK